MFRVKISLLAALLVVLLTVVIYLTIVSPLSGAAQSRVTGSVDRAAQLVIRSQRLEAYDLLSKAQQIADSDALKPYKDSAVAVPTLPWLEPGTEPSPEVKKLFIQGNIVCPLKVAHIPGLDASDEETRKKRNHVVGAWAKLYTAIEAVDNMLTTTAKPRSDDVYGKPAFIGILDSRGVILARDMDDRGHWCGNRLTYSAGGKKINFKNMQLALKGTPAADIWDRGSKLWRSAAVPIRVSGKVVGALVIAYEITTAETRKEGQLFGTHVMYFKNSSVMAFSFALENATDKEDGAKADAVSRKLFSVSKGKKPSPGVHVAKCIKEEKTSKQFSINLPDEKYLAVAGFLPSQLSHKNAGFVVLSSLTAAKAPVNRIRWLLLLMGLAALLLVLGGMYLMTRHFVNAEDKVELGVSEVINGNLDYTFEGVEEFEGLANAINTMLARLLGRPEPGQDLEESEAALDARVVIIEEPEDEDLGSELAGKLAAETSEAHIARLYDEYVEMRNKFALPTEGLDVEEFTRKLKANEALLKAKFKCDGIRFVVMGELGKVSFKPVRY